jgi:PKD repeat protein
MGSRIGFWGFSVGQMINCCANYRKRALALALFWFASAVFLMAQNPTCSITVTPNPVALGLPVSASGSCSDTAPILSQVIDWNDGTTTNNVPPTFNVGHTQGTFTVKVTVTDVSLGTASASQPVTVAPPALVSIAVTPANPSFPLGTTQPMTATGTYTDGGTKDLTNSATWITGNAGIATVDGTGLVTSKTVGTTSVTATSGTVSGSTNVTVTPAALVSIAVAPANPNIPAGETQQFTATGTFTDTSKQDITTKVTWSSSDPTIASISNATGSQGLATGVATGPAIITATSSSNPSVPAASTTLTVTAAVLVSIAVTPVDPSIALGTIQQFKATGTYSDNTTKDLTSKVTWASDTTSVATIDKKGLATSVSVGAATISATANGPSGPIADSTLLTVTPAALVSIAISPAGPTIPLGTTQQFTATGTYTDSTTKDLTAAGHWTSSNAATATISNSPGTEGLATSKGIGTTTIGFSSGAVTAPDATLTVSPAALVSIAISPQSPSIPLGDTQQFTATGTYTDNSTKDITDVVTWSSSSAMVAIISNTSGSKGLATSAGLGTTNITAALGTVNATTTLTVGTAALVSIAISPANTSIPLGASQPFTATGTYSDDSTKDLTASVTWSSDAPSVVSIAAGGLATAMSVGTAHITATSGSITQTTAVTVTPPLPPVCSPQVTPSSGKAPLPVTVTANCLVLGDQIVTTIIDLGDGFYQSGASATHTYVSSGNFTVTVTAIGRTGNVSIPATVSVTVSDIPTLFVGVSNGQIEQFDTSGKLLTTLNTNQGGSTTGMAFDSLGALYVTDFTADTVTKFDGSGKLVGSFGSGYNCKPESIVFDEFGNAYVGETGCSHAIVKFDAYGNLLAGYAVTTEIEGSDWIELASDQCTIYYTSQGTTVFRFNACNNQQGSPFATGLNTGLALKFLPDGGMLVANNQNIVRLDSAGRTVGQYTASGENCWVSLTLDRDGTSFWALDYCSSDVFHFDINSGNQLSKFNAGTPTQTVFGIAMRTPPTPMTRAGAFIAAPQSLTISAGQTGSLQLSFSPVAAVIGQDFSFSCGNLPIGTTCTFSPQTATAASNVTVNLSFNTTKASASLAPSPFIPLPIYAFAFVFPGILLGRDLRAKRRGSSLTWIALIAVMALLGAMLACGGSSSKNNNPNVTPPPPSPSSMSTPPGTYSVVVRATAKSFSSATVVTLKVQ